jgi:hypothetical protein
VIIVAGLAGELFVRGSIVVWGDAAATAANIARSEGLWRLGVAGDILMHVCDVPLMLIFYVLLEPVSRNLAMLSVLFTLVQSSVMVATKLNLLTALFCLATRAISRPSIPISSRRWPTCWSARTRTASASASSSSASPASSSAT